MPKQRLVIDGSDHGHFFLQVHDGILTLGPEPAHADLVLANLRIRRLHCEFEVEECPVLVGENAGTADRTLQPGQVLHVGGSHISLVEADDATADASEAQLLRANEDDLAAPVADDAPTAPTLHKRFLVIDGADKGRAFPLNVAGRIAVGKSAKHADIVLHDLLVARVHCELQVDEDSIMVAHVEGQNGTLVNGEKITQHLLQLGDVLRVGNSQLRLELDLNCPAGVETVEEVEVLEDRAGELAAPMASPLDALFKLEGQLLGHYQIGAILGRGQSSLIFHAQDKKSNHAVALKVLAPTFPANEPEIQGLVRVLKAVAPLRHPHLVTLFGAGKTGPYCWIAREHIQGENLAGLVERLAREDRLGWKRACRVAVQLGRLLSFLQLRQVTHTSITPANILIETGTKGTKLADVMLDKALDGSRLAQAIHEDRMLAEQSYRAPEQLEPGGVVDHRASLYSLGTVLYTLLTGQPPYSGITVDDVRRKIHEGKITRPSKFLPEIPAAFEAVILKLLARRPDDRFQTAGELLKVVDPIAALHEIAV